MEKTGEQIELLKKKISEYKEKLTAAITSLYYNSFK